MASLSVSWVILFVFYFLICRVIITNGLYEDSLMVDKHNEWMARFQRVYKNDIEKAKRYKIFKKNVEFIESFNSNGNQTFVLGINEFTDLTREEFLASHTGYVKPMEQTTTTFKYESATDLPSNIDWREKGAVTNVKNQGNCGCCWAFSAVAAIEGIHQINTGNLISFSEQDLLDCNTQNHGCSGGMMEKAFEFVMQNSLTSDQNYPYQGSRNSCNEQASSSSPSVRISSYEVVPPKSESALMQAVANQPVSIGVDSSCLHFYAGGILTQDCGSNIDHAITLVGYGTDQTTDMKYWLAKNSWGESWGEKGYIRMQRDVGYPEGISGLAKQASYPNFSQ